MLASVAQPGVSFQPIAVESQALRSNDCIESKSLCERPQIQTAVSADAEFWRISAANRFEPNCDFEFTGANQIDFDCNALDERDRPNTALNGYFFQFSGQDSNSTENRPNQSDDHPTSHRASDNTPLATAQPKLAPEKPLSSSSNQTDSSPQSKPENVSTSSSIQSLPPQLMTPLSIEVNQNHGPTFNPIDVESTFHAHEYFANNKFHQDATKRHEPRSEFSDRLTSLSDMDRLRAGMLESHQNFAMLRLDAIRPSENVDASISTPSFRLPAHSESSDSTFGIHAQMDHAFSNQDFEWDFVIRDIRDFDALLRNSQSNPVTPASQPESSNGSSHDHVPLLIPKIQNGRNAIEEGRGLETEHRETQERISPGFGSLYFLCLLGMNRPLGSTSRRPERR